jgi:hypothetical protein
MKEECLSHSRRLPAALGMLMALKFDVEGAGNVRWIIGLLWMNPEGGFLSLPGFYSTRHVKTDSGGEFGQFVAEQVMVVFSRESDGCALT